MIFGILLSAVLLGAIAPGTSMTDDLWFFADFDSVPRIDGRPLLQPLPEGSVSGRFGKGYAFVSDEKRCDGRFWTVRDQEWLRTFPRVRGTFACWFRSPEKYLDADDSPAFGYCGFWQRQWTWRGASFSTGSSAKINGFSRSVNWRHFAATWNDERLVLYLDGQRVAETPAPERIDMSDVPKRALRIGAGFDGSPAANLEMDEIAIFRRDLSPNEIKALAKAEKGLLDGCVSVVAESPDFPIFWRNQSSAALRMRLHTSSPADVKCTGEIAGEPLSPRTVALVAGVTRLVVPFNPARLRPGKYPWKLRLAMPSGAVAWQGYGELEVRPRLERDVFKLVNWGGWKGIPDDYLRSVGINSTMVDALKIDQVRQRVSAGFFPNLRYENLNRYKLSSAELDPAGVRQQTHRDFADYEGLHVWVSTLVNSEVYSSVHGRRAAKFPGYLALARRQLGFEPNFQYRNAPIEIDAKTVGEWPAGVISRGSCPQLDTLRWVMARGMLPYLVNALASREIHAIDSQNIVWSEPSFEGIPAALDMLADWHYQYLTSSTVRELRTFYAHCRPYGKPYMPTLAAAYYHGEPRPTLAPADGRKKRPGTQSADEMAIKAWLALAAVPAHALSFFALDGWSEGEELGFAEPGTGARFGRMWRERIAPAADLLRDLPNERAPVAVVLPGECRYASGLGWGQVHYPACIESALEKLGVPYDVVYDRELELGTLKSYRYAILPMAKTIYADHITNLVEAAAAGCRIVTDSYAVRTFDGSLCLDALKYPYDFRKNRHIIEGPVTAWAGSVLPGLREQMAAWSDDDGKTVHTFVKAVEGVRYVVVINDQRQEKPGFLNGLVSGEWYRPYGAPQQIATHFNVPAGSVIYEFDADEGTSVVDLKGGTASREYGAAQARIFCVYPKPLTRLYVDVRDEYVRLVLFDVDGKPAPGRQVVAVEVREPGGALHDETGRYVMTRGCVKIPLRLAKDDPSGTATKGWQIQAKELTTGLTATTTWYRGK